MRKPVIALLLSVLWQLAACALGYANNISITNDSLGAQNETDDTIEIQFDLSWENSWRKVPAYEPLNYDAAWVFVKYSTDSGATWSHAYLSTQASDHTIPANYECKVGITSISSNDRGMGVFIQRQDPVSASWSGTASPTGVRLMWRYGQNGVTDAQAKNPVETIIRVMAIEMVYIPQGTFSAGSGGTETSCFTKTMINTADATVAPSGDPLSGGYPQNQTAPSSASWPNGYGAFYIMKYEISQEQYVDLFNTLTSAQKTTRDITGGVFNETGKASDAEVNRNTISWSSADASAGANANVACNFLSWADLAAYADWAGLRPFTELEYEKACRGAAAAVANEYAWGSNSITQVTGITDEYTSSETATNFGNAVYGSHASVQGPMRCGFAATSSSTKVGAGSSYCGVMELSGNLWERCVTIGHPTGRSYTGLHGDGNLNANGDANVADWPGTDEIGSGFRGGNWDIPSLWTRVSERAMAASVYIRRYYDMGARAARTAP
jgi:formylglycine-generating enzyme required for sulfatase activity